MWTVRLSVLSCASLINLKVRETEIPKQPMIARVLVALNAPFLHLLILSIVFHTFFKLITSNKKYTPTCESIYPFCKFKENPPIFM